MSVDVDVEVGVGCEIDCKTCNKRLRVRLEIVVGGITAEVEIEGGKGGGYIGLPSSLVTRGF
jgi:hypothetical protein